MTVADTPILTRDVFVAGGIPSVTYNPRADQQLEEQLANYLGQSGKALCVAGPTKCGKTVLVQRTLPVTNALWIDGNDLVTVDVFWRKVVDYLNLYDQVEVQVAAGAGTNFSGTAGLGPSFLSVSGTAGTTSTTGNQTTWSRIRAEQDVAREALKVLPLPIVIDDFHYVPMETKRDIARVIKSLIPSGPMVLIAVNSDAFEVVRAEPDLNGRIWHLGIEPWKESELVEISARGFEALNLADENGDIGRLLAKESCNAPFLMQQLCYDLVAGQGVLQRQEAPSTLLAPDGWPEFLTRAARRTQPALFEDLLRGPKVHGTKRITRHLRNGGAPDIYGAVLCAIALSTDPAKVTLTDLRSIVDSLTVLGVSSQEIGNTLNQMSRIAENARGESDPILVYRHEELHVIDPFLGFYLRRAQWEHDFIEGWNTAGNGTPPLFS